MGSGEELFDGQADDVIGRLMEVAPRQVIPDQGVIFIQSDGAFGAVHDRSVGHDALVAVGAGYSGEAVYFIEGDTLECDWVCTDPAESEYAKTGFENSISQTRGLLNALTAIEAIALKKGCARITTETWFFKHRPQVMEGLGFRPLYPEDAKAHDAAQKPKWRLKPEKIVDEKGEHLWYVKDLR